jgi:hypothetical protein
VRFLFAFELWPRPGSGAFVERAHTFFNKSFASALDGCLTRIKSSSDLLIGKTFRSFKQDPSPRYFTGRRFAFPDESEKFFSLISS